MKTYRYLVGESMRTIGINVNTTKDKDGNVVKTIKAVSYTHLHTALLSAHFFTGKSIITLNNNF